MPTINQLNESNPTVDQPKAAASADLIPMGMSELQLAVPEIPGYVLYWPCDRPGRIPRMLRQGWEFVEHSEVDVPNFKTISGNVSDSGNADLGDRVCVFGYTDVGGRAVMQYLMKIKRERWEELDEWREQQSDRVVGALKGSRIGVENEAAGDAAHRYQPKTRNTIFDKKR